MYTLYGSPGSGAAAIEAALDIIGAPYRNVTSASWEHESDQTQLLSLNPLGQVPTLQTPEGQVLTESAAILLHLALQHPEADLLPAEPAARARALRGLVFIAANCYSAIGIIDYPQRWLAEPGDTANANLREGATRRLHLHWSVFAEQFADEPLLSGSNEPGALDLLAVVVSKWSGTRRHLREQKPAFFATLQRIEAHPVVAAVFARHWPVV